MFQNPTWQYWQVARHEVPEGGPLPRGRQVLLVPVDEIHRHVHCILCVALKAKIVVPDKGQNPAAVRIHVLPHMAPPAEVTCSIAMPDYVSCFEGCFRFFCVQSKLMWRSDLGVDDCLRMAVCHLRMLSGVVCLGSSEQEACLCPDRPGTASWQRALWRQAVEQCQSASFPPCPAHPQSQYSPAHRTTPSPMAHLQTHHHLDIEMENHRVSHTGSRLAGLSACDTQMQDAKRRCSHTSA